jgi:hypothetical protein
MGWKGLSSWLKGGIIGMLIFLIFLAFFKSPLVYVNEGLSLIFSIIFLFPIEILSSIFPKNLSNVFFDMNSCFIMCPMKTTAYILAFIIYFLMGALVGFIVSKSKGKAKK